MADWKVVGRLSDHLPLVDANCDFRLKVPGSSAAPSETLVPLTRLVTYKRSDGTTSSQVLSFGLGLGELLQFRSLGAFSTFIDFTDFFLNKGAFDPKLTLTVYEPSYPSWQNSSAVTMYYAVQGTTGKSLSQSSNYLKDSFRATVQLETRCVS